MNKVPQNLPDSPGVYLMKDRRRRILYVGKAGNLKRRVSSYFLRVGGARIEKLIKDASKIDYLKTDSALEALILEAELIKKYRPPYNVREKDDTSFLYIEITKEKFPRVLLVRGKSEAQGERFGPFTLASSVRQALRIMRKLFPWSIHPSERVGKFNRACLDYEISLCPGTCLGIITQKEYLKNIRHIKLFLAGKKRKVLSEWKREMSSASRGLDFERADKFKRRIFSLQHIQDVAFINESEHQRDVGIGLRIEGYDISNISGTSAVGSMVVFVSGQPAQGEYKKFRIKTVFKPDDTAMIKEVLRRRLKNEWPLPDLILIDGGKPQITAAGEVLNEGGIKIPIVGIAKGRDRKKNEFIGRIPKDVNQETLIRVRDEAHRFAISYHKKVRGRNFIK